MSIRAASLLTLSCAALWLSPGCRSYELTPGVIATECVGGGLTEGADCAYDASCVPGLVCVERVCKAPGGEGAVCTQESHCADGFLCGCVGSLCNDEPDRCHAPQTRRSGQRCRQDASCVQGVCLLGAGGVCGDPQTSGAACGRTSECAEGLTCNRGFVPAVCTQLAVKGERCGDRRDCLGGLVCGFEGAEKVCMEPTGVEGTRCDRSVRAMETTCGHGLVCNLHHGTCVSPANEGEPCGGVESCAEGLSCNHGYEVSICTPLSAMAQGDPCYSTDQCQEGLICGNSLCQAPGFRAQGDVCQQDRECADHLRCAYPR